MQTGERFRRWTVVEILSPGFVVARCDCGTVRKIRRYKLATGHSKSCGCWRSDQSRMRRTRHGHTNADGVSSEYSTWCSMKQRCSNPNEQSFPYYGGRGIAICERWADFQNFLADMGLRPSPTHQLDRIDNEGNYTPENCRWTTKSLQMQNRRNTRWITFNGETLCLAEWARKLGKTRHCLEYRLNVGWSIEKTLSH